MKNPATILGLVLVAFFIYTILAPVIGLLISSVQVGVGESFRTGGEVGDFTTYYLERVFTSRVSSIIFWEPLLNTLGLATVTIFLSLLFGVPLAFLLVRTDLPHRAWFATALIIPYMIPSWTFALAWKTIFKNRQVGGGLGWMENLGWTPPDWVAYGFLPIVVIFTLNLTPFVILLVSNAIKNIPEDLDEVARTMGIPAKRRVISIFLPLLKPAIISAATLIVAKVIGDFGVTYTLGKPVKFQVLATTLYQEYGDPSGRGVAAVIALAMVFIGALSLMVDFFFLKNLKRFTTMAGKSFSTKLTELKSTKNLMLTLVIGYLIISVVFPLFVLILSTIMKTPGVFTLSNFTIDYWIGQNLPFESFKEGILLNPRTWDAARNTILFVGVASVCTGVLGMLVGYVTVRSPWKWLGATLKTLTFMPYLVPGIAFSVALITVFAVSRGPIPALYGTSAILILAMILDEMPFASRAGVSAMSQMGKDAEDAAKVIGARWTKRMYRIVLPIQRSALASAILLPFVSGVQTLSLVIVLATPGTQLLTTLSMDLIDNSYDQMANGVTVLICAIALFGTWAAKKLLKADLASGMGG
ncbi:MAG: iron ABC transporter permease [Campylobacteraceae bacterium]|nr:iron ABC transporter permease [Campylobacteraceae bacterium]